MKLIIHTIHELPFVKLSGTVIVADVLRATSSIVTMLASGAEKIFPVNHHGKALQMRQQNPTYLLAGEENGLKAKGFDLGNSPVELEQAQIKGQTVVMSTTNGTKAIVGSVGAGHLLIGSFLNLEAVIDKALQLGEDITIVCSEKSGIMAYEDHLFAAVAASQINHRVCDLELGDSTRWAINALQGLLGNGSEITDGQVLHVLRNCSHGKHLIDRGFSQDLEFIARRNYFQIVPELRGGALVGA